MTIVSKLRRAIVETVFFYAPAITIAVSVMKATWLM